MTDQGFDDSTAPFSGLGPYEEKGVPWGTPDLGTGYGPFAKPDTDSEQPSDDELHTEIEKRLNADQKLSTRDQLKVEVHDGVVTVTGPVKTRVEKMIVGAVTWNTPGVHDVHNNVAIQR